MRDRDDQREYEGDVFYEAWRRGMDPDRAVRCANDCYWDGKTASECVDGTAIEMRRERERREEEAMMAQEQERQYYEQQEQQALSEE